MFTKKTHSLESRLKLSKARSGMKYQTLMNCEWRTKVKFHKILICTECNQKYLEPLGCLMCQRKNMFKKQEEFPLIDEFKKHFPITERTIFAYDHVIYCNRDISPDLIVHEKRHFEQQDTIGLERWVYGYLNNDEFRLEMELDAYKTQIKSIKDRNHKFRVLQESARNLSSDLYGNLLTYEEAISKLK